MKEFNSKALSLLLVALGLVLSLNVQATAEAPSFPSGIKKEYRVAWGVTNGFGVTEFDAMDLALYLAYSDAEMGKAEAERQGYTNCEMHVQIRHIENYGSYHIAVADWYVTGFK